MKCPECKSISLGVYITQDINDFEIYRRRVCNGCKITFPTLEVIIPDKQTHFAIVKPYEIKKLSVRFTPMLCPYCGSEAIGTPRTADIMDNSKYRDKQCNKCLMTFPTLETIISEEQARQYESTDKKRLNADDKASGGMFDA